MSQRCSGRGSPDIRGHVLVALHLHKQEEGWVCLVRNFGRVDGSSNLGNVYMYYKASSC